MSAAAPAGHDRPLELAACHGRIDAYRYALGRAAVVLELAALYVGQVLGDPDRPERDRDAAALAAVQVTAVLALIRGELEVTT